MNLITLVCHQLSASFAARFSALVFTMGMAMATHAQTVMPSHPAIEYFMLKFEDGNPSVTSNTMDSAVYVVYVIELKDSTDADRIYVRISTGNTNSGDVYQATYLVNSQPTFNPQGACTFKREGNTISIRTVQSTQLANLHFEVSTDNAQHQVYPYISWE